MLPALRALKHPLLLLALFIRLLGGEQGTAMKRGLRPRLMSLEMHRTLHRGLQLRASGAAMAAAASLVTSALSQLHSGIARVEVLELRMQDQLGTLERLVASLSEIHKQAKERILGPQGRDS